MGSRVHSTSSIANNYYKLLGISSQASPAEIKEAYRILAKTWHPDRYPDQPAKQQEAEEKIKQINIAYEYLKNHHSAVSVRDNSGSNVTTGIKTSRINPQDLIERAISAAFKHRYQDALTDLNLALKLSPDNLQALAQRAIVHERLGSDDLALRDRVRVELLQERAARAAHRAKQAQKAPAANAYKSNRSTNIESPSSEYGKPRQSEQSQQSAYSQFDEFYLPDTPVAQTWEVEQEIVAAAYSDFAIGRHRKTLATGHQDYSIHLWNIKTSKCFGTLVQHQAALVTLLFSHDDQFLISADQSGVICVWHLATASLIRTFNQPTAVSKVLITPENILICGGQDGSIYFWSIHSGKQQHCCSAHKTPICQLVLSDNSQILVTVSTDNQIQLWQYPFSKPKWTFQTSEFTTHQIIADAAQEWLSVNVMGQVEQWSASGKVKQCIQSYSQTICQIALHPDKNKLAIGIDHRIRILDRQQKKIVADLNGHDKALIRLQFSYAGKRLISADASGVIKFWTVP